MGKTAGPGARKPASAAVAALLALAVAGFAGCGGKAPAPETGEKPSSSSAIAEEWQTYSDEPEVSTSSAVPVDFSFEDNFDDKSVNPAWYGHTREDSEGASAPAGMSGGCAALAVNKAVVLKNIEGVDGWADYTVEADVCYWACDDEFEYYGGVTGILARCNGINVNGNNEKGEQNRFISFALGEMERKLVDRGAARKIPLTGTPVLAYRLAPNLRSPEEYEQWTVMTVPWLDLTKPHKLRMDVKGDAVKLYCDGKEIKFEGEGVTGNVKVEIPEGCEKGRVGAFAYNCGGKIDNFKVKYLP